MSGVSDNQSIGDQPIRSPSVSDEILYELGYSISPSTEDEAVNNLTKEVPDQSWSNKGLIIDDNTHITRLDFKHNEESDHNSLLKSAEKEYEDIDFQIGIQSSGTSYPGHKLKDKKYLRKFKKRKRRKKGTTCSPTKLEAICREMSGLVVSEDDVSATETSPESEQMEESLSRKEQSCERSSESPIFELEGQATKQRSDEDLEDQNEGIEQDKSNKNDEEANDGEQHLSDGSTVLSVNTRSENSYLDKTLVVVEEHAPSENGNSRASRNCTHDDIQSTFPVCLKLVHDSDEDRDSVDLQETVNLHDDGIIQSLGGNGEDTEKERKCQENEDNLSSTSRGDKEDPIESSKNLSETITSVDKDDSDKNTERGSKFQEKEDNVSSASIDENEDPIGSSRNLSETIISVDEDNSACKELNYEDLFGNIKKCSIKVKRLSEESIAVYTGRLTSKETTSDQPSEIIHTQGLSHFEDELASSLEKSHSKKENTGKDFEKILNDEQSPTCSSPEKFANMLNTKTLSVRLRRLSGETIASYTSGTLSPQNEKNDRFKTPKSPLKSKSKKRRSRKQCLNSGTGSISPKQPKVKGVHDAVKKTSAKSTNFSGVSQSPPQDNNNECSRSLRSRSEEKLKESPIKLRKCRTQIHETASEVNFRHKSNPRNAKIKVDNMSSGDKSQCSNVPEKIHGICNSALSSQSKPCIISLKKIGHDEAFTKVKENIGKKRSGSEIFKIPLAPKLYQEMRRSGKNCRRNSSFSSAGRPRTRAKQSHEMMSEVNTNDKLSSVHSWQEKFIESLNKPLCRSSSPEVSKKNSSTGNLLKNKRGFLRGCKLNESCHENVDSEIASCKTQRKKRRNGSSCCETLNSSQSSPIKLCSVRVRRLSGDTIASYLNKMPGMFDNIVKNLTKRSEQNSVLNTAENQRREQTDSGSDFRVPSLPPRKRKKSGDSLSSLSKWSTRRQALKTSKTNTKKIPKRKWIDLESEDSESSVRPGSVKLSRLDPDSVSHCEHNWVHGGVNMPNQIHNPALNVTNLDKVVDDELYCLRRFLQVPPQAESKASVVTGKLSVKQDVPKLKACSVVLKRITRKQNLESVNIKKVIAKQLADNVEFSSGSESDHEEEEESMNINKLLFALKDPFNGREEGGVSKEGQKDMLPTEKPEDKIIEGSTKARGVDESYIDGENTAAGSADPQMDEVLQNVPSPEVGKGNGEQDKRTPDEEGASEETEQEPYVGINSFPVSDNTAEELVKHGFDAEASASHEDQSKSAGTSGDKQEVMNDLEENLQIQMHQRKKPESDIWSDNLPDIEMDKSSAMEEMQQNTSSSKDYLKSLSCVSVYSDTNESSNQENGEQTSETRIELCKDYFHITTKSCSVRLQRIDVSLNL